jgi:hypothetical protein
MLAESGPIICLDRDSRRRPGAAAGIWACGSQKALFALERARAALKAQGDILLQRIAAPPNPI